MDISGTQTVNLNSVTGIIEDYNENIRYYNRNIRELIEIYREEIPRRRENGNNTASEYVNDLNISRTQVSEPPSVSVPAVARASTERTSIPSGSRPAIPVRRSYNSQPFITNDRISYPIIYNDYDTIRFTTGLNRLTGRYRNNLPNLNDLENVVVRPNNNQIRNATQVLEYNTNSFTQRQCPITLESFVAGQEIRRINYCGHIFDNTSLIEWFERNVRCPVCRHDIRDMHLSGFTRDISGNIRDNSGNRIITTSSNIVEYDSESEEEEEEKSEYDDLYEPNEPTQTVGNRETNNSNENTTTTAVRSYLREVLSSVINDNRFPELNNSVNSIFANYNIPFILDISYTSI